MIDCDIIAKMKKLIVIGMMMITIFWGEDLLNSVGVTRKVTAADMIRAEGLPPLSGLVSYEFSPSLRITPIPIVVRDGINVATGEPVGTPAPSYPSGPVVVPQGDGNYTVDGQPSTVRIPKKVDIWLRGELTK